MALTINEIAQALKELGYNPIEPTEYLHGEQLDECLKKAGDRCPNCGDWAPEWDLRMFTDLRGWLVFAVCGRCEAAYYVCGKGWRRS